MMDAITDWSDLKKTLRTKAVEFNNRVNANNTKRGNANCWLPAKVGCLVDSQTPEIKP
jgi:hypothetical protein